MGGVGGGLLGRHDGSRVPTPVGERVDQEVGSFPQNCLPPSSSASENIRNPPSDGTSFVTMNVCHDEGLSR